METKDKPGAVCLACERPQRFTRINAKCAALLGSGQRCGGLISSAVAPGDWAECPACLATGSVNDAPCGTCHEEGWIYVRDKRWLKDRLQRWPEPT